MAMFVCEVINNNNGEKAVLVVSNMDEFREAASRRFNLNDPFNITTTNGFPVDSNDLFLLMCQAGHRGYALEPSYMLDNNNLSISSEQRSFQQLLPSQVAGGSSQYSQNSDNDSTQHASGHHTESSVSTTINDVQEIDIRAIFRNSGRSDIDELFRKIDVPYDEHRSILDMPHELRIIKKVLGTYIWKKNGTKFKPKPEEFDKVARALTATFPITKVVSEITPNGWEIWYQIKDRSGYLDGYVSDKRCHMNKINRKRVAIANPDKSSSVGGENEDDIYMLQNDVTIHNENEMLQRHKKNFTTRRSWILSKQPTASAILEKYPRFVDMAALTLKSDFDSIDGMSIAVFVERWFRCEGKLVEQFKGLPLEQSLTELAATNDNSKVRDKRTQLLFTSLPHLLVYKPSAKKKGGKSVDGAVLRPEEASNLLIQQFPEGTHLESAKNTAKLQGMIQPGLIVIGEKVYVKIDQRAPELHCSNFAESVAFLFATYFVFNLKYPEALNLVYGFLEKIAKPTPSPGDIKSAIVTALAAKVMR